MTREQTVLDDVSRIAGVRSALLVSAEDGIVVAESTLEGEETAAVAALAGNLARRLGGLTQALTHPDLNLVLLQATLGQLFIAFGGTGLLLVALTDPDVNIGQVRLGLFDAAGRLN
ncbi:MAG: roadblock/LC7 domain-containing protein [Gemmatimonadota bacterium]